MRYRFYDQAYRTLMNNDCKPGDIISAFNMKVIRSGICPTITTRPEGLKTAILVVIDGEKTNKGKQSSDNLNDV